MGMMLRGRLGRRWGGDEGAWVRIWEARARRGWWGAGYLVREEMNVCGFLRATDNGGAWFYWLFGCCRYDLGSF